MGPLITDQPATANNGFIANAVAGIKQLIERQPQGVAQLLSRHGYKVAPTHRNVGNAAKIDPAFFGNLMKALGDIIPASHTMVSRPELSAVYTTKISSFVGDDQRLAVAKQLTTADKLANAGLVFSNIIRDIQHPAEPYQKRVPDYYEPTGAYNTRLLPARSLNSGRIFGMDKKAVWIIGGLIALALLYEFNKK